MAVPNNSSDGNPNPFEQTLHKSGSITFSLLRMLSEPCSYQEIKSADFGASEQQLERTFCDLERRRVIVPAFSMMNDPQNASWKVRNGGFALRVKEKPSPLSPVLLIGGGIGEATIGLSYLASYLRQNGISAWIWNFRERMVYLELKNKIANLFQKKNFALVGISYKWYHHVCEALFLGAVIRELFPTVPIVYGGNSATLFWKDLIQFPFVDGIILGDGEKPLLELCHLHKNPANCVLIRNPKDKPQCTNKSYSQRGLTSEHIRLTDLEDLFLSKKDLLTSTALIVGGKGCNENCIYCGGSQPNQVSVFQREHSFLRPPEDVRNDILKMLPYHLGFCIDFTSQNIDLEEYLRDVFADIDFSEKTIMLASWSIPTPGLLAFLSSRFLLVWGVIDVGCFSEKQRLTLWEHGLFKHSATNKEILDFLDICEKYNNVLYGLFTIYGLPLVTPDDFEIERKFVKQLQQRQSFLPEAGVLLQAQPGALVTECPQKFEMEFSTKTFWDYLSYFEETGELGHLSLRVRFKNKDLDRSVVNNAKQLQNTIRQTFSRKLSKMHFVLDGSYDKLAPIRLEKERCLTFTMKQSEWLGDVRSLSEKDDGIVCIFKNLKNICIYYKSDNVPFDAAGNDHKANKIASDILAMFETPRSISEAFQSTQATYPIKQEEYLEFIRSAYQKMLLKVA